ncbi:MAG TPA: hypothetical protein VNT01_08845 [Symbiobacteriaceae bacterium]|nr:hypothetical protein [Symbiobacteriaceae bacterium]
MEISLRAVGKTIVWSPDFKQAMEELCAARLVPDTLPERIGAAPMKNAGLLLLWPLPAGTSDGHEVHRSPQGRRVTTDLSEPFTGLGADIPDGLVTEIPVTSYRSPKHGLCLALQFQKATFLYKESRGSAIGLMDDFDGE